MARNTLFRNFYPALALIAGLATASLLLAVPGLAMAQAAETSPGTVVALAPDAPARYTVQRGDTLWDLSARFLQDPWRWPDLWHANPQVKNPDLIYPGDELVLSYVNGQPQLTLQRAAQSAEVVHLSPEMRGSPLRDAIPAIPYEVIAAFMSRPTVVAKEDLKLRPYVVALRDQRLVAAAGGRVFARLVPKVPVGTRYSIVHVGEALRDPDTGNKLGYQGTFAGIGRLEKGGDPATLLITESARETLDGDLLFDEKLDLPLDFIPHAPKKPVHGSIISVVDGVSVIGQYQVVVINRGRLDGLEPGHVLAIHQAGERIRDGGPKQPVTTWTAAFRDGFARGVRLPTEHAGTFLVFKTYPRLSYGLIVQADIPLRVGDTVRNP